MRFSEFYEYLLEKNYSNVGEFLKENWKGAEKQETLIRLFAFLGIVDDIIDYTPCSGNFNLKTVRAIKTAADYRKLFDRSIKDNGDASDLTMIRGSEILATTSKNLKEYHLGDLDIDRIYGEFNKYEGYNLILCIVIPDKKAFYEIVNRAELTSATLVDKCSRAVVLDHEDLNRYLIKFYKEFRGEHLPGVYSTRRSMKLHFHQQMAVDKFINLRKRFNEILLGCIPRSGKSYIVAGIITFTNADNYLIMTTCPNETIAQYVEIFATYSEFKDFHIHVLENKYVPKLGPKNIIICSQQYMKVGKNENIKSIKWLADLKIDIVFSDEAHNGGTTRSSGKIMEKYGKGAAVLYITATYNKPVNAFNIHPEAQILWDLEDVRLCKVGAVDRLREKHKVNPTDLKEYSKYPDFHVMSIRFEKAIEEELKHQTIYGWSTKSVFLLKQNYNNTIGEFQDPDAVKELCYSIFGKINDPAYQGCIMSRIRNIVNNPEYNSRWFSKERPLIVMCFLPGNGNIDLLMKTFKPLLEEIVPDFEIDYINSKRSADPLKVINDAYALTENNRKKGLIVLSGTQCSLGVSIHNCDIVLNLNNSKSFDQYMQMGFRGMTEAPNKRCGFLVDLNIQRTISLIVNEGMRMYPRESVKGCIKKMLMSRVIHFNADELYDHFESYNANDRIEELAGKLMELYNKGPDSCIDRILDSLVLAQDILHTAEYKLFSSLFTVGKPDEIKKLIEEIYKNDINEGVEQKTIESSEKETQSPKEKEERKMNFMKDIMRHVIPLISILTIGNESYTFIEMCKSIGDSDYLSMIFIEQLQQWWGKVVPREVIFAFIKIYEKSMVDNEDIRLKIKQIKELFVLSKENKRKLSQDIDKYLIPQDMEKKKNAEVSTPYKLRQEMLDTITTHGDPDFWRTPKKVFEPCAGKGGFLIDIVDRFLEGGLSYKTIVEECLYFADINPTNIFICRLLLDPYNTYALNCYQGDTLKLDIQKEWGLKGFDAVIGNPPYNASGSIATGNTIWQHFVKKSLMEWIVEEGYLIFVHPPGWRKPCYAKSQLKGLFELMTHKNNMLWLSIHGIKDGQQTFKCGTKYDWYIILMGDRQQETIMIDERNSTNSIDLRSLDWLPNYGLIRIKSILSFGSDDRLDIVMNSAYHATRSYVSKYKTEEFIYPCVHSTPKSGVRYMFSKVNDKGHFGVPKIIFGEAGINDVIIDLEGKYGMTQGAMAIVVNNMEEADGMKKALLSADFKDILDSCSFGNFRIDWRMFTYFKKDFWKEFS